MRRFEGHGFQRKRRVQVAAQSKADLIVHSTLGSDVIAAHAAIQHHPGLGQRARWSTKNDDNSRWRRGQPDTKGRELCHGRTAYCVQRLRNVQIRWGISYGSGVQRQLGSQRNLSSEKAMQLMVGRSISGNPVSRYSRFGYCNRS